MLKHPEYWVLLFLFIVFSCTQEIELKTTDIQREPVLSGLISPGRNSIINLGTTSSVLDDDSTKLEWTDFELWKGNDLVFYEPDKTLQKITVPGQLLRENCRYTLVIKLPNGKEVTATDSIPALVRIDRAEGFIGKTYDSYGAPHYDYAITFTDPPDERNYYELLFISQNWWNSKVEVSYLNTVEIADPAIQAEGLVDYNPVSFVFSDNLFNGREYTLNMKMFNEGTYHAWLSEPMVSGGNGDFFILRSVSRTYYDFRKSWLLHKRTRNQGAFNEEPLATLLIGNPTSVISNVTNGYGILAAYVQDFIKVDVKQWKQPL